MTINNSLKEIEVSINDLLLDPNNPRFSKHHDEITSEDKFADEDIQKDTYERMKASKNNFKIDVLLDAIKEDGFIPVDKIFIRKIKNKYLVIEGNRRITAIKTLLENSKNKKNGHEINDDLIKQISNLKCVLIDIDGPGAEEKIQKILGLRHHGSILPWKPLPAAFNLYKKYMDEYCLQNGKDPADEENFIYDVTIAKKVARIFSVKWIEVRSSIRLYRIYRQLLRVSNNHPNVEKPESFSFIEETLGKDSLEKFFEYDEVKSIFSEKGVERILDLYFGINEDNKPPVITGASVGTSNIRDLAYIIAKGTDEDKRRIIEDRENAQMVKADIVSKSNTQSLPITLELVMEKLTQIHIGDIIKRGGFAPNEKDSISRIDEIMEGLKRAAGLK